jgi:hypothetical protein
MLHSSVKYLELVGKNAEGFLHHPSCLGQPVVEDPFFMGEVS